jgi:hypothetical protein
MVKKPNVTPEHRAQTLSFFPWMVSVIQWLWAIKISQLTLSTLSPFQFLAAVGANNEIGQNRFAA